MYCNTNIWHIHMTTMYGSEREYENKKKIKHILQCVNAYFLITISLHVNLSSFMLAVLESCKENTGYWTLWMCICIHM